MIPGIVFTGVWSTPRGENEFFTSVLYPYETSDNVALANPSIVSSSLIQIPTDNLGVSGLSFLYGDLITTISYVTYNNPLMVDNLGVSGLSFLSGDLITTISYVTYNNPLMVDNLGVSGLSFLSGSLDTTIVYVTYNNGAIENIALSNPTIISGTLT